MPVRPFGASTVPFSPRTGPVSGARAVRASTQLPMKPSATDVARLERNLTASTKPATYRQRLPPFPHTCFSFIPRHLPVACSAMTNTPQPASWMVHASSTTAPGLQGARDARCIWLPNTSANPPPNGNHRCAGNCQSRWIGRCVMTTWRLPLFAVGHAPTGAITAPRWHGAAPKAPMPTWASQPLWRACETSSHRWSERLCMCSFAVDSAPLINQRPKRNAAVSCDR